MDALIGPVSAVLIFAVVAAPSIWFAKRRGRSMVIWGALGVALPLIGVLLLVLVGQKKEVAAY